jgi:sulfite reductase (NADPH) hemoprotein beta-component
MCVLAALLDNAGTKAVATVISSPGLLFISPALHTLSKANHSGVLHVGAGPTLFPSMSIFGEQTEVMSVRQSGCCLLSSHTVQECHDLALVAHLASVACSRPFVHFFDGLRTSHQLSKTRVAGHTVLSKLKKETGILADSAGNVADTVEKVMSAVNQQLKTNYSLFEYAGAPDAELVIVIMGSGASVVEETVPHLEAIGYKAGVLKVHLYRPWSPKHFLAALPKAVTRIAVLERATDETSQHGALLTDVMVSFEKGWTKPSPQILGGVFGLGNEDLHPGVVRQVFEQLRASKSGPGEPLKLQSSASCFNITPSCTTQCIFWGLGGDGCAPAVRRLTQVVAADAEIAVQAYFLHDSNSAGTVTSAHLRFGRTSESFVNSAHLVEDADVVCCFNQYLLDEYDVLGRLRENGTLLLNSTWSTADFEVRLDAKLRSQLAARKIKLVTLNAVAVAKALGLQERIDIVMQISLCCMNVPNMFEKTSAEIVELLSPRAAAPPTASSTATDESTVKMHPWIAALKDAVSELSAAIYRQEKFVHSAGRAKSREPILKSVLDACTQAMQYVDLASGEPAGSKVVKATGCESFPASLPHMMMPVQVETPYLLLLQNLFGDELHVLNTNGHLFLDNAEYGLGVATAEHSRRKRIAAGVHTALLEAGEGGITVGEKGLPRKLLQEWANAIDTGAGGDTAPLAQVEAQLLAAAQAGQLDHPLLEPLTSNLQVLQTGCYWIVGGDGWSYDVGYSGIDLVLNSGHNLNILLLETSSLTETSASQLESKVAMGLYAMEHSSAFVASVSFHAGKHGDEQLALAVQQACAYNGPSLVLAYCPEDGGAQKLEGRRAVDEGTWPLYRWEPPKTGQSTEPQVGEGEVESEAGEMWLDSGHHASALDEWLASDSQHTVIVRRACSITTDTKPSMEQALSTKHEERLASSKLSQESLQAQFAQLCKNITGSDVLVGSGTTASSPRPITVLFASDGGNGEELAKRFAEEAKERGHKSECMAADQYDLTQLNAASKDDGRSLLLCVVSTAGQGDFPGNAHNFWKTLKADEFTMPNSSEPLQYAVMALGDRDYWPRPEEKVYFCKSGRDLDERLHALGGERLCPLGIGDDQDEDGWETGADKFQGAFWAAIESLTNGSATAAAVPTKPKPKKQTVEDIKLASRFLRGTIAEGLVDTSTGALAAPDTQLTKFHGIYQQDDRDLRAQLQSEGKEKAYSFMIRVAAPGGLIGSQQWLDLDGIADKYANGTLKITTRQAVQYHGIVKNVLKKSMQGINKTLLTSLAACGDVNRNIMCSANPLQSSIHAEAFKMSCDIQEALLPRTSAYHEIWMDKKPVVGYKDIEPLYSNIYLPRKFKIAVAVPPNNDCDVFAHCLGYIAIIESGKLVGWNVTVGGGMGMTHNKKVTFPRVADMFGFITTDQAIGVAEAVVMVQRDFGNRADRKLARLKYTIEGMGLSEFKNKVEAILGYKLPPVRPYEFASNTDRFGWTKGLGSSWHYGMYVPSGRVQDVPDGLQYKTALRAIAAEHKEGFMLTSNQNLIINDVSAETKPMITQILKQYQLGGGADELSGLRTSSMACTALPTCGHALAEAERYLPDLCTDIDEITRVVGLFDEEIVIRMTGCPNGCARPYLAEIALVGRAPGIYNLYLGASHTGDRLSKLYKESLSGEQIVAELTPMLQGYAKEGRRTANSTSGPREWFGDYCIRAGYIKAQVAVPKMLLNETRAPGETFHEFTPIW